MRLFAERQRAVDALRNTVSDSTEARAITDRTDLPTYTVRVSPRARQVRLVLSLSDGLQVVIPRGFDVGRVPEIVRGKIAWIERAIRRLRARADARVTARPDVVAPDVISLPAVGESWPVVYVAHSGLQGVTLRCVGGRLVLTGRVHDIGVCRTVLKRWLASRARSALTAQLADLCRSTGLAYARLSVRGQRSRWGSCSVRANLSLNYKLLFLPSALVRYVLVHELCHTRQPNHGADFWALVAQHEPDYRHLRAELRRAGRQVPEWVL